MGEHTIKARIQLKNDTEAHWNLAVNFIPKVSEPIVYLPDETHDYCRLKIGDGVTPVSQLKFSDCGGIDLSNIVAKKVAHKLTFGSNQNYVFDGSEDVTVPTYTGVII